MHGRTYVGTQGGSWNSNKIWLMSNQDSLRGRLCGSLRDLKTSDTILDHSRPSLTGIPHVQGMNKEESLLEFDGTCAARDFRGLQTRDLRHIVAPAEVRKRRAHQAQGAIFPNTITAAMHVFPARLRPSKTERRYAKSTPNRRIYVHLPRSAGLRFRKVFELVRQI